MSEKLADEIAGISERHFLTPQHLNLLQQELVASFPDYLKLNAITDISQLRALQIHLGLEPAKLARSAVINPLLVVVDDIVPTLCQRPYLRDDGTLKSCGGYRHNRSCCPPFAPSPVETQQTLNQAKAVVTVQAEGLIDLEEQKQLHFTLLGIEKHLKGQGQHIIGSWAAGPCRVCPECLGFGECRSTELKRYSMEGSGISVFTTMDRLASITGDPSWKINLIENWGLPNQSSLAFKSVVAIAVG